MAKERIDVMPVIQQLLDRFSAALERHDVPAAMVEEWQENLAGKRWSQREGHVATLIRSFLLDLADGHMAECDDIGCRLCERLAEVLAAITVQLRMSQNEELTRRLRMG